MVDDRTRICSSKEEELDLEAGIPKILQDQRERHLKPFKVLEILVTRDTHNGMLKLSQSKYIDSFFNDSTWPMAILL